VPENARNPLRGRGLGILLSGRGAGPGAPPRASLETPDMRDVSPTRTLTNRVLRLLPFALLTACAPDQSGSGYDTVTHRGGPPALPEATHPEPPAVPAGTTLGGGTAKVTLAAMPAGMTQEMIDQGQTSFGTVCAACHGAGGAGTPAAPALNDKEWLNIAGNYEQIVATVTAGVPQPKQYPGMMPPKGGGQFTDQQVKEIAAYVYALSHQGNP
jgi:mono/diheme cytochrome c family protein